MVWKKMHCHDAPPVSKGIVKIDSAPQIFYPETEKQAEPAGNDGVIMSHNDARPVRTGQTSRLSGTVFVPGDKSISHRALILGALADGCTRITGLLQSGDVLATARALGEMGAEIEEKADHWHVTGRGTGGLRQPGKALDFGNSGTAVRLMTGVIAGHDMKVRLTGDRSLSSRPMGRVLTPLKQMGLQVTGENGDVLPLEVQGSCDLVPIRYELPVASAQVKSAIMLAGLHAPGQTVIIEPKPTRDHSERMMRHFGAHVDVSEIAGGGRQITVGGHAELTGCEVVVPGDPSSAAFLIAGALIVPGSELLVENVLINPTRTGFYTTLREMGADLSFENERDAAGEPVADIRVRYSPLKGVVVPPGRAPSMIDEYPMLAALSAFASGTMRMEGLAELRVKESDRLAATKAGLDAVGVTSRIDGDALVVEGTGGRVRGGGRVSTCMDHRIAMSFLTLGLGSKQPVEVDDVSMTETSFPGFLDLMRGLGAAFEEL